MKVVADNLLRERLNNFETTLDVVDDSGRIVGRFVPTEEFEDEPLWTAAEIAELVKQEGGGATLAEIWRKLGHTPE